MSTPVLYGIKNCDTVKKARKWLEQAAIDYRFHDFREDGIDRNQVRRWIDALGWDTLVNRRSTTWKQLAPAAREAMDADTALTAVLEHPTLVKRPLLDIDGHYHVGFRPADYDKLFKQ